MSVVPFFWGGVKGKPKGRQQLVWVPCDVFGVGALFRLVSRETESPTPYFGSRSKFAKSLDTNPFGSGSKLNYQETAGLRPCFHLPGSILGTYF